LRRTTVPFFLLILAWPLAAWSAEGTPDTAALHERTDKVFAAWDSTVKPGCALSVMQEGRIVYKRGYGMADLDHDVPITPRSVFHVASVSKQFTATAILLLAQDGKLSLDDDIHKYIKEVPDFGVPITIRQLVHHTSGLRDQWDLLGMAGWRYSLDLITDDDVLELLSHQKDLNFKPGEKHVYCNTGYTLLAQIVKRVSGQSFRDFTTRRIFAPLGMNDTHFRDDHAEIVKHIAYGYEQGKGENVYRLSVTNFDTVGATSLLTTVEDLQRWDENFYNHALGGDALFEQQLLRGKLNNGKEIDYASGLVHGKYRGLTTIDHAGGDAGYRSDLIRFPDQHFSVACLCNQAETNPSELTRRVADIFLEARFKEAAPETGAERAAKPFPVADDRLAEYAGLYWKKDDDGSLRIAHAKGRLFLPPEERHLDLSPVAENRFRIGTFPVILTFDPPSSGRPSRVSLRGSGEAEAQVFERVQEFHPTPDQLREFAGTYTSAEIEPVYRFVVEDGNLALKRLKAKPAILHPTITDRFDGPVGDVQFSRDAQGKVTGLSLNTGRIQHLRFSKADAARP